MLKISGVVTRKWVSQSGKAAELTVEVPLEAGAKYPERIPFKAFGDAVAWVKAAGEGESVDVSFVIRHRKKTDADKNVVQVAGRDFYETTLVMTGLLVKDAGKPKASEVEDDGSLPF
jgi:Domain of unknown function (DUF3127)